MEIEPLNDPALLWEVIDPVLRQYNPSKACMVTLFYNITCQLMVEAGISREEFVDHMGTGFDIHHEVWRKLKNEMD